MINWLDIILWLTHAFYILVIIIQDLIYRSQIKSMKERFFYENNHVWTSFQNVNKAQEIKEMHISDQSVEKVGSEESVKKVEREEKIDICHSVEDAIDHSVRAC